MTPAHDHPSFFELDQATLLPPNAALQRHLDSCEVCRQHLAQVRASNPPPPWILGLTPNKSPQAFERRWLWPLLTAATAALGLFLIQPSGPRDPHASEKYVASKGAPTLSLHVKRGERVWSWKLGEATRPGDLLRLSVVTDEFSQILVATPNGSAWRILYRSAVEPGREVDLPESWRVDNSSGPEQLMVILSRRPVTEDSLADLASRMPRSDDVWTSRLVIEKLGGQ